MAVRRCDCWNQAHASLGQQDSKSIGPERASHVTLRRPREYAVLAIYSSWLVPWSDVRHVSRFVGGVFMRLRGLYYVA